MDLWTLILCGFAGLDIVLNVIVLTFVMDDNWELIPELINPIVIYKAHKVNYFGCLVLTLIYHTLLSPFAIGYWLYKLGWLFVKLCTVGRE